MLNYSFTEENYIKEIYHLQTVKNPVSTNNLAAVLKTKAASVTDMLKKLNKKKLVNYKAYYGCSLTKEGRGLALMIIRRHRLWEYFLCQKLGFSWHEVHQVAEELEHVGNLQLINKLDEFLGFPRFDPHGDPIPDADGNIEKPSIINLNNLELNKPCIVTQIGNQTPVMLEMLNRKNILLGSRIEIVQKHTFDQSMEVKVNRKKAIHITKELAQNIFITTL